MERDGTIDLHFGQVHKFLIYGINSDSTFEFVELRELKRGDEQPTISGAAELIDDCKFAITSKAGPHAAKELKRSGIEIIQDYSPIETALKRLKYYV